MRRDLLLAAYILASREENQKAAFEKNSEKQQKADLM